MTKAQELRLLIEEYDPQNSDWQFRKGVMLGLIDRVDSQPQIPQVLWCCHARGPDDLYAAPDYETALLWSDVLNEINWQAANGLSIKNPESFQDCIIKAVPALWPHSAESHAEDLPRSMEGFSDPRTVTRPDRKSK